MFRTAASELQVGSNNAELSSLKLLHNTLELVRYRLGGNWGKLEILSRENFPRIFLHNGAQNFLKSHSIFFVIKKQ